MTPEAFRLRVDALPKGRAFTYHSGNLAADCEDEAFGDDRVRLEALRKTAREYQRSGRVYLKQRRTGPGECAYLAQVA